MEIEKQLERAKKYPSFEIAVKKLKKGHPSWIEHIKKHFEILSSLAPPIGAIEREEIPSLEECYRNLGQAIIRKTILEQIISDISGACGFTSILWKCRETELLRIRTAKQIDLLQKMIFAIIKKELL